MAIEFTRKAYLEVWRGTRYISRHTGLLEAGESASRDAEEHGSGDYHITIGGPPESYTEIGADGLPHNHAAGKIFYMARADVTIRFSESTPAFAYPVGAESAAAASAVSAPQTPTSIQVPVTGADTFAQAGDEDFGLSQIPATLSIPEGTFVDMSQYIIDEQGRRTSTAVIGTVNTTYDSGTERLTGVNGGTNSGLVMTMSDGATSVTSNAFGADVTTTSTSDTPDYADPVAGVTLLGGRTTINVSNDSQLATALSNAVAGQTIQLAAGTYSNTHTLNKSAPANNPIIVQGADNFASICSNKWTVDGDRNIITGIKFSGASVNLNLYGNNCKIIGNEFTGWGSLTVGSRYAISARLSTFAEIAYNEFYEHGPYFQNAYNNHPTYGGDGSYNNSLRLAIRTSEGSTGVNMPTDTWVHHNLFRDFPDKARPANYSSSQNDALEWGETGQRTFIPTFSTRLYFESNMLLRHLQGGGTGAASVDLKVGGDSVCRYNTFIDSPGRMAQRGPTNRPVTWESNYFNSNSGGLSVHGCGGIVVGNRLDGGTIFLVAGSENTECDESPVSSQHPRASNTVVAGNVGPLTVGVNWGSAPYLPANNTLIEQHTGSISQPNATGTINNSGQATSINFVPAVPLTESQVGPDGLDLAPAAYKDARGL